MRITSTAVDLALPLGRAPRSHGVHLSRIIRGIALETGVLKPEWADDLGLIEMPGEQEAWWAGLDQASRLRMCIGLAWEDWYIPRMEGGSVVDHPGEMQVQGVYMTHDGESIDTILTTRGQWPVLALHEVKATYKSTKTVGDMTGQWMWLSQCKGYCKGLETLRAYLHVLFLCGDYKYPITPQLRRWQIDFTQAEIDENWELMQDYLAHQLALEREEAGLEGGV